MRKHRFVRGLRKAVNGADKFVDGATEKFGKINSNIAHNVKQTKRVYDGVVDGTNNFIDKHERKFNLPNNQEEKYLGRAGVVLGLGGVGILGKEIYSKGKYLKGDDVEASVIQESLDGIKDHFKRNKGKYITGGALGAGYGATHAITNGYAGVGAQDFVQKQLGRSALEMSKKVAYNNTKGDVDGTIEVLKRPDNWIGDRQQEHTIQDVYQKENIPTALNYAGAKVFEHLGNFTNPDDRRDFMIRNPGFSMSKAVEIPYAMGKGVVDSVKEHATPFIESSTTVKIKVKQILLENGFLTRS